MSPVSDDTLRRYDATAMSDPLIGMVVDSYQIESHIGSGAMGIVYRGVHTVIGKAVAIKVLKADYADDPEMVQRLIREARTVNAIRHPAIVDIFGFGTLPRTGQPFIVMDLLDGQPLDQFIAEHAPMPPREVLPLLDELLGALGAAHDVGVIHRDLKPGNVFIENKPDRKRALKVIDFGLARQADRAGGSVHPTNPGTLLGTPAFMAPEQVEGTRVSPETDLYAVGGIAYQMLTAHLPHEGPSAIELLSQKMQHDPVRPRQWQPKLPDELDAWVMKLLSREVKDRFPSAGEARAALKALQARRSSSSGDSPRARVAGGASGASPSAPRREWGDAKTVLTEQAAAGKAAEVSTNEHVSPWAKTNAGVPAVAPPAGAEAPTSPGSRAEVSTSPGAPAEPTTPAVPTVDEPLAAPRPSGARYVVLSLMLIALIGGLLWLLSVTPG